MYGVIWYIYVSEFSMVVLLGNVKSFYLAWEENKNVKFPVYMGTEEVKENILVNTDFSNSDISTSEYPSKTEKF